MLITYIYSLSLHDALPISPKIAERQGGYTRIIKTGFRPGDAADTALIELVDFNEIYSSDKKGGATEAKKKTTDRKSTRLNSSHPSISYAVFCLKKKINKVIIGMLCCLLFLRLPSASLNVVRARCRIHRCPDVAPNVDSSQR